MQDKFYSVARHELVESLRKKGIKNETVLEAIQKVPRHAFIESGLIHRAYEDVALPIGLKQTISQPFTVAIMTEQLNPSPGQKYLEIGTGSGYQAAVLTEMGVKVYSIERHAELLNRARTILEHLRYHVACKTGDGTLGWSEFAPYDGIIVTAGSPKVPKALIDQLAPNGRLVIPIGSSDEQDLHIISKNDNSEISESIISGFRFVPLIGRQGW